jgi:hypothetical protein
MRRIYVTVAAAVNKIIYDMYKAGAVLILPTRVVRTLSGVHFSPMHWIKKKDKECDENHNALNDEDDYVTLQILPRTAGEILLILLLISLLS